MSERDAAYLAGDGRLLRGVSLDDILAALAVPGLGPVTARRILDEFGGVAAARRASADALAALGLRRRAADALRDGLVRFDPDRERREAEALGARLLPINDDAYPSALRRMPDPPLLLYVKGALLPRDALAVAVVGCRRASIQGIAQTDRLAGALARAGFTVVSGLARGIDGVAHEAAVRADGRTLAVLGNGLRFVYPQEHAALAERIAAHGALLTELPLDTAPVASNFPPRNRIIAGLSLGVLVVEAYERSGALITARLAGELGREVFAVPGDVTRPQTRGVHHLLRDGAKLVERVEDILDELGPLPEPLRLREDEAPPLVNPRAELLNEAERRVYDLCADAPRPIDEITAASALSPANVASLLTVLEMKRLVRRLPGMRYVHADAFSRTPLGPTTPPSSREESPR